MRHPVRFARFLLPLVLATGLLAGCDVAVVPAGDTLPVGSTPVERAMILETSGCGAAAARTGSAIRWNEGVALTAAHLVVQADSIQVDGMEARVIGLDTQKDLAALEVPGLEAPPAPVATAERGDGGRIVGAATSGTVDYEIITVANLSIEEVLGTERSSRLGYELAARTTGGDSGAGAYDRDDRLVGMVFASADDRTWITASSELQRFMAADARPHSCDPDRSQQSPTLN